jgi:snurportin-1
MSDFRNLYKNVNQLKEQQSLRRSRMLEAQKNQRNDQFSFQRDLKEILSKESSPGRKTRHNFMFKNNLMLSEWMMELPEDIDDFLLIACPKGKRCTLSMDDRQSNIARLYYKNGSNFLEVKTNIPAFTILDCVYSEVNQTIFILDVIAYAGRDLIGCDAEFRFFWLKSKFIEDDLKITDDKKNLKLNLLVNYPYTDPYAVSICFQTPPLFPDGAELDGFLFYHKEGSYTSGETPLVLWTFPFMIPELFEHIRPNDFYQIKPANYTNYLDYIADFNAKLEKKKNRGKGRKSGEAMEHETSGEPKEEENIDEMQAMIELEMTGSDV